MRFALNKIRLHVFDIRDSSDSKLVNFNKNGNIYSLVQTIGENESNCTYAEIKRENEAKPLPRRMGGIPSEEVQ